MKVVEREEHWPLSCLALQLSRITFRKGTVDWVSGALGEERTPGSACGGGPLSCCVACCGHHSRCSTSDAPTTTGGYSIFLLLYLYLLSSIIQQ